MVPKHTDKFWLVPRIFSDKSGWENLSAVINNSGLALNGLTVNDYLANHDVHMVTTAGGVEESKDGDEDADNEDNEILDRLMRRAEEL